MSNYGRNGDLGRIQRRPYRRSGPDRQQRLMVTIGVGAAIVLLVGGGIGFAIGRATAPEVVAQPAPEHETEQALPAGVVETITPEATQTESAGEDVTPEETPTDEPPPRPKQLAPDDGAEIDTARVDLEWSEVEDDSGEPVTYAFEIQNRQSDGEYGDAQVISGLESTSYSARVLDVKRRWRVWATDDAGNKSKKTGWDYYQGQQ